MSILSEGVNNLDILQAEILSWAKDTFGEPHIVALAVRGNKEMAELLSLITNSALDQTIEERKQKIAEECADNLFFLLQICEKLEVSLYDATVEKFKVNKQRSWKLAEDGSFQHAEKN